MGSAAAVFSKFTSSEAFRLRKRNVKTPTKNDYRKYVCDAAKRAAEADNNGDLGTLHRIVKELTPKKPRPLNLCRLENGENPTAP